jgi:hypothetical protein
MPDQALARRHDLNLALPQYPAGGAVSTTRAKAQQAEHLISGALVELDTTYRKVETFVSQPGRSYLVDRGMDEIIHTRPREPNMTPIYIEPPRQPFLKRLMGL